jgi:hypothetical protein
LFGLRIRSARSTARVAEFAGIPLVHAAEFWRIPLILDGQTVAMLGVADLLP